MTEVDQATNACGNSECSISRGIHADYDSEIPDGLTFGRGQLSNNGYWEIPCTPCARAHETNHPEYGECWPFKAEGQST